MKQNQRQKQTEFSLCLITFHGNASQLVVSLVSIMVTFRVATTRDSFVELKRFLLYAFCSDKFKIATRKWT